ncbi:unnamed protein product [Calicophoron daubneyi]|uniref:BSD domain-containing protein n=1 Tax=Calicophoron daubneyi TaxID=300641 RepID=A0AAV2TU21_CALDB
MDYLKGYVNSIATFATSVIDNSLGIDQSENQTEDLAGHQPAADGVSSNVTTRDDNVSTDPKKTEDSGDEPSDHRLKESNSGATGSGDGLPGIFDWVPKFSQNPVVHYMNSLASFGSAPESEESSTNTKPDVDDKVVVEDVAVCQSPTATSTEIGGASQSVENDRELAFIDWVEGLSSRTGNVWKLMKQDFSEVLSVVSKEPKEAVSRTASSVRQHLSAVADAAKKIDPNQFLLPEQSDKEIKGENTEKPDPGPPESSELPSLSNLRSDVSQLVSGFMSVLFGPDECRPASAKDKREARLQILRADPATYENEPPPPPPHLGLINYTDWRTAYFDETTCQPRPGIPLCGARDASNIGREEEQLIEPPHPSPEELLDTYPFMRKYLTQLVRVDDQSDGKGITDADFWSRYYYRVWLLDVTEKRRQRLAERVASKSQTQASDEISAPQSSTSKEEEEQEQEDEEEEEQREEEEKKGDEQGSSGTDDKPSTRVAPPQGETRTSLPTKGKEPQHLPQLSPQNSEDNVTESDHKERSVLKTSSTAVQKKSEKRKQKRRKGKKRHELVRNSECEASDSGSATDHHVRKEETSPHATENPGAPTEKRMPTPPAATKVDDAPRVAPAENKSACESDEIITSGSSSVVVLSNSEDEQEDDTVDNPADTDNSSVPGWKPVSPAPMFSEPQMVPVTQPESEHHSSVSDSNMEDWGDVCEEVTNGGSKQTEKENTPKLQSAGTRTAQKDTDEPDEDWANWS